ncbi:uncharacterized protein RSE6_10694 [Rhynchosporium secalis]|uniref:Uncharacterized protein n=1 Tax=Rhynchosporium secalis TaxID=38038 RepID=A0A1E1ML51_RHYSE|nr:uncharacterized protein RSE6_10694 [Rhynchosporium secalis]
MPSYEDYKQLHDRLLPSQESVEVGNQQIQELLSKAKQIKDYETQFRNMSVHIAQLRTTLEVNNSVAEQHMESLATVKSACDVITRSQHRQKKTSDKVLTQLGSLSRIEERVTSTSEVASEIFSSLAAIRNHEDEVLVRTAALKEKSKTSDLMNTMILNSIEQLAIIFRGPGNNDDSDLGLVALFNEEPDLRCDEPLRTQLSRFEEKLDSKLSMTPLLSHLAVVTLKCQTATLKLSEMVASAEVNKKGVVAEKLPEVVGKVVCAILWHCLYLIFGCLVCSMFLLTISEEYREIVSGTWVEQGVHGP